jgi:hypothetical protein
MQLCMICTRQDSMVIHPRGMLQGESTIGSHIRYSHQPSADRHVEASSPMRKKFTTQKKETICYCRCRLRHLTPSCSCRCQTLLTSQHACSPRLFISRSLTTHTIVSQCHFLSAESSTIYLSPVNTLRSLNFESITAHRHFVEPIICLNLIRNTRTSIFGNGIQRCLASVILGLGISTSDLRTERRD